MSETALVVDDSSFQRSMIKQILKDRFEQIEEAKNGQEAIEQYESVQPDFVTMDIQMPERDGVEATGEITAADDDATVVMCTSVEQEQKMIEAIKNGATDYIVKPIEADELLECIEEKL